MVKETVINDVHTATSTSSEDEQIHNYIEYLYNVCTPRILSYLNNITLTEVPDSLTYVLEDYMVFRYNKKGNEGKKSSGLDVFSASYMSDDEFLAQYIKVFDRYNTAGSNGLHDGAFIKLYS